MAGVLKHFYLDDPENGVHCKMNDIKFKKTYDVLKNAMENSLSIKCGQARTCGSL